jgi:putative FmdB family regulatory protein
MGEWANGRLGGGRVDFGLDGISTQRFEIRQPGVIPSVAVKLNHMSSRMPLYEYACRRCGHRFERRMSFDERLQAQTCPTCQTTETTLVLSAPGFIGSATPASAPSCANGSCTCGRFPN